MKSIILPLAFLLILFTSCTLMSNGKLEQREECGYRDKEGNPYKVWYLINSSSSKVITFNVKETKVEERSGTAKPETTTSTETYTLQPGSERYLGCSGKVRGPVYSLYTLVDRDTVRTEIKYEVVGAYEGERKD